MKIYRIQSDCGGYQKPKGHLDTQMYPECEGTRFDRDIVKKNRKKKQNKKASYEVVDKTPHKQNECPFCGSIEKCRCPSWVHEQTGVELTKHLCDSCKQASIKTAKKKKRPANETPYNPWAVCHTKVDKDKDPEKYERCVQKVKKQNLSKKKKSCSTCKIKMGD
ncbi:MAG: hypothetical protein WC119_01960 [Synergistaceae bacterium]